MEQKSMTVGLPGRLRKAIGERALREVARAAACSDTAIRELLSGEAADPRIRTVERLARALGVRPEWLAYGTGPPDGTS